MSMVRTLAFKNPLLGLANVKCGGGINQLGIVGWHIRTLTPSNFIYTRPYSHPNLMGEQPTWKLTLSIRFESVKH